MTFRRVVLCGALWVVAATAALAGPPYLTDDPDPVPYHHWEFYTFLTGDWTRGAANVAGPAFEVNNGVAPSTQLHLIVPESRVSLDGVRAAGPGDIEAGVKYRLRMETPGCPEIATFPLIELPTGDSSEGLGNGRAWGKIPLWIEKNRGPWTSYGGGGYAFNNAPGERDFAFGGLLVQRTFTPALTLGAEVFLQGAQARQMGPSTVPGARESSIWNAGGTYNFTPDFSLLFSAGHSFQGDGNSVLYVALYRTWGPGAP
ncbi:MAG: hypothetical protein ACLQVD_08265 [Capsulimonadaceae bacterium]